MTRTDWFPPNIKPAREGVYECAEESELAFDTHGFQYWNGAFWGQFSASIIRAHFAKDNKSRLREHYWRGLSEKPE